MTSVKIHTHKLAKTIKKTLIAMGILLFLALLGGTVYVFIVGREETKTPSLTIPKEKAPLAKQTAPNPDAPASAAVQYIASPTAQGQNTTINIQTNPRADCTIVVAYNNVVSKDSGLIPKTADVHGSVVWSWTVDPAAAVGKWPVKVTCKINNKTGYVEGYLEVTK